MSNYWTRTIQARISRRRALAATGAGALVAAVLAACGGDNEDSKEPSGQSGLVAKPVDTTDKAKAGGVAKTWTFLDIVAGLDPLATNHRLTLNASSFVYSRLFQNSIAKYPKEATQATQPDVAESYELSPDKLTLTMKLRQGMKWDSRAPTNGRTLDVQDVLFSWNKFSKRHPYRSELVYDAATAKAAPVESVTNPDSSTLVFKLKQPDVSLLPMLSSDSYLSIMPRESDGGFDPRADMRGSGMYKLEEYSPSLRSVFTRNPDHYIKGRPYPDRYEVPLIPEYATRLAQFRSGQIYTSVVNQEDVIQTKKDLPDTVLYQASGYPANGGMSHLGFGYEGSSPWKDVRMRRALSMTVDRDAFIDTQNNRDRFVSEGFDVPSARSTFLLPGWTGAWLDPANEKEFGSNAKYLGYDVAEAKKLMAAAGNPNGVEVKLQFTPQYGPTVQQSYDLFSGFFTSGGFKVTQAIITPQEQQNNIYFAYANKDPATGKAKGYSDIGQIIERSGPTVPATFYAYFHPAAGNYKGVTPDGTNVEKGDPQLTALIEKMKVEFDVQKQNALAKDAQRIHAGQVYTLPHPGFVLEFDVTWPALSNLGVYNYFGATRPTGGFPGMSWAEGREYWWIDSSKPPLGRA